MQMKAFIISDIKSWIQHYVISFVSDLRQVGGFLRELRFLPPTKLTKTNNWNMVEIGVKRYNLNSESVIMYLFMVDLVLVTSREKIT
jgi:hypothetical protein